MKLQPCSVGLQLPQPPPIEIPFNSLPSLLIPPPPSLIPSAISTLRSGRKSTYKTTASLVTTTNQQPHLARASVTWRFADTGVPSSSTCSLESRHSPRYDILIPEMPLPSWCHPQRNLSHRPAHHRNTTTRSSCDSPSSIVLLPPPFKNNRRCCCRRAQPSR